MDFYLKINLEKKIINPINKLIENLHQEEKLVLDSDANWKNLTNFNFKNQIELNFLKKFQKSQIPLLSEND